MTQTDISDATPSTLLNSCSMVVDAWKQQPHQGELRDLAKKEVHKAAAAIANLPKSKREGDEVQAALSIVHMVCQSGLNDGPASEATLELATELRSKGWPGILASMVLLHAWQNVPALSYDDLPLWLWSDFTRYLFVPPVYSWSVAKPEAYEVHLKRSMEMLVRLNEANRGSAAIRASVSAFLDQSSATTLALSSSNIAECLALRGRLLPQAFAVGPQSEAIGMPREGRALKLGICLPRLSDAPEVRAIISRIEHLSPLRFDVNYFVLEYTYGKLEEKLRARSTNISLIDAITPLQSMHIAGLDAALLVFDPLDTPNAIAQLGTCRFAPLQMATNLQSIPTGYPEIDLFLSSCETSGAPGIERIGVTSTPPLVCHLDDEGEEATASFSRETLGVSETAKLLVSFVHYKRVSTAMIDAWAAMLSSEPDSILLLHPYMEDGYDEFSIQSLCAALDQEIVARGIEASRIAILGTQLPLYQDWVAVMKLADVCIDSHPSSSALSVSAALDAGIPVVCWTGEQPKARAGTALLESLQLGQLVASNAPDFVSIATRLLRNVEERQEISARLQQAFSEGFEFHDSLAASDSFGGLVEAAFDQVILLGNRCFKNEPGAFKVTLSKDIEALMSEAKEQLAAGLTNESLRLVEEVLAVEPTRIEARRQAARILAKMESHARAAEYLLAVMQKTPNDAGVWFDLGFSLSNSGKMQDALQALETSLRLDDSQIDAWFFLGDLTIRSGNASFATEVAGILEKLAPNDDRLAAFKQRIQSIDPTF